MASAMPVLIKTFVASGAINPFTIVKAGAADGEVATGTAVTEVFLGVAGQDTTNPGSTAAYAAGDLVPVIVAGTAKVKCGTGVTRGQRLTWDTGSTVKAAATTNMVIGVACTSASAGDIFEMIVTPGNQMV